MKSIDEMARRALWRNGRRMTDRRSHEFCVAAKKAAQHEAATIHIARARAWRAKCGERAAAMIIENERREQ